MILSDIIVASYVEGFSGVYIDCTKDKIDEVTSEFNRMFEEAWYQAMDDAEEDYDAVCQEKEDELDIPAKANIDEGKIFISIEPLYLSMNYGARADNEYGPAALENTLKGLKQIYPDITYSGVIAYEWYDEHGADVVNYEISSDLMDGANNITYPFISDIFDFIFSDAYVDEFWEKMEDKLYDADERDYMLILRDLYKYHAPEESIERLLDFADENDTEIRETLEDMLEKLTNGEEVDIEEPELDTSGLPAGYMEMMAMLDKMEDSDEDEDEFDNDEE